MFLTTRTRAYENVSKKVAVDKKRIPFPTYSKAAVLLHRLILLNMNPTPIAIVDRVR